LAPTKIVYPPPAASGKDKLDYLLGRVTEGASAVDSAGKGGYFARELGFDRASLEAALRRHLVENFDRAVHRPGKFADETERIEISAPVTGPSGATRGVRAIWAVTSDGRIRFITAQADRRSRGRR
jgi:hypothetical protein